MIAVTPAPVVSSASAPSAGATSPQTPPASPFDAILTLEALAATCAALDTAPLGGGALEGGGAEGLDETSSTDSDEGEDSDAENGGPLAFLVNLLNLSAPATPDASAQTDGSIDDVLGGQGHKPSAESSAGALLQPKQDGAPGSSGADADAAGKLLLAEVAAASGKADIAAVKGEAATKDSQATQDTTAGMARAAEMLAQGPRHTAGAARDNIATPVHSPRWAEDVGARVAMMVRGGESSASLQLTPVDLGPVEVNVTVRDSQASIHFGAAQAETRALLEASIPKLREMLAAQGFNLMDASVSQGFSRQARADAPVTSRADGPDPDLDVREAARLTALGLLDTYA
jgi:flagellar hook-length control protein FliK